MWARSRCSRRANDLAAGLLSILAATFISTTAFMGRNPVIMSQIELLARVRNGVRRVGRIALLLGRKRTGLGLLSSLCHDAYQTSAVIDPPPAQHVPW